MKLGLNQIDIMCRVRFVHEKTLRLLLFEMIVIWISTGVQSLSGFFRFLLEFIEEEEAGLDDIEEEAGLEDIVER